MTAQPTLREVLGLSHGEAIAVIWAVGMLVFLLLMLAQFGRRGP